MFRQQGRTTMMWNDMLVKHAEATSRIPNDIIMCDWMYENLDGSTWTTEDMYWNKTLGRLPKVRERLFESYWAPNRQGEIQPFPYLKYFRDLWQQFTV